MNILAALTSGRTAFRGNGVNHEREAFIGELNVQSLEAGRAALLCYKATLETGVVVHSESTLLGTNHEEKLCLWPVMSEMSMVLPHTEVTSRAEPGAYTLAVFASSPRENSASFREEITIQINSDGTLLYAHAWGLPGGDFKERSSCHMAPRGA